MRIGNRRLAVNRVKDEKVSGILLETLRLTTLRHRRPNSSTEALEACSCSNNHATQHVSDILRETNGKGSALRYRTVSGIIWLLTSES